MNDITSVSRRTFLKGSATSLVIGVHLPMLLGKKVQASTTTSHLANAFVKLSSDNTVTVLIKHIEFGQGVFTGLSTLVAEELDAAWSQMSAEHAPADTELYKNLAFGVQGTGGSTATANSYMQLRRAGAMARKMLVEAAAQRWQAPADQITVSEGVISHAASGKSATFGELAQEAASQPLPEGEPTLKKASEFKLIGQSLPKLDSADKSRGKTTYTLDIYKPDMLTAVIAYPPVFGATLSTLDDSAARRIAGVVDVKRIDNMVAVYAKNTHAAIKGHQALKLGWDRTNAETRSSQTLFKQFSEALQGQGIQVVDRGNAAEKINSAGNTLNVEIAFPYLAHAPMETLDAVIMESDTGVDVWMGSQLQTIDQAVIAGVYGVDPGKINIHTMISGGSFGRRAQPDSGFAMDAAKVAKAMGKGVPVKTMWTREDDIKGGRYRPMAVHQIAGALDDNGRITAWQHGIAVQSIMAGTPFEGMMQNGIDPSSVEGVNDLPYDVPNLDVQLHNMEVGVSVLWWRAVGHTHTGYAVETFIDMLLERAERDPIQGRLALLGNHPREQGVLKKVDQMINKAGPLPEGRARGVAVVKSFGSYVAQVAEVSRADDNMPKVHKVWCAIDCGIAVNPNVVKAQMEGGIGYGLDALLHGEISLNEGGEVAQSNFHNYASMRINEMPEVEVEIVASDENPTGVGEPGTPPIGPAVSNAWRRLTGEYVSVLPFSKRQQAV